ncbi:MAG: hypothetical protein AAGM38_00320 [Pseudomonadota bacterium]
MSYIAVRSAAETALAAQPLGGRVELGPLPAPGGGAFALIRDPLGGGFTVIVGAGLSPPPRRPRHGEPAGHALYVSEKASVAPFHQALFGWRAALDANGSSDSVSSYRLFAEDAWSRRKVARLIEAGEAIRGREEYWAAPFAVHALDAARAAILSAGGSIISESRGLLVDGDPTGAALFLQPAA